MKTPTERGQKGGEARAARLSEDERKAGARKAAAARWLQATHKGEIDLAGFKIPCFVLDDGRRLLSKSGIIASLDMSHGGAGGTSLGNDRLLRFTRGKIISQYVSPELVESLKNPVRFRIPEKTTPGAFREGYGYVATILADLCEATLRAHDDGKLQQQQLHVYHACNTLMRGFARVGLIALIDEATGYQYERERNALAEILETFIAKELAAWVKTFPDDFYAHLHRLLGHEEQDPAKRPMYFGGITNNVVYSRLAPGVLEELKRKNPRSDSGRRKSKHHQWLTPEIGHPKLREHIASVVALMKISASYPQFARHLDVVAPQFGKTMLMPFMANLDDGAGAA